MYDAGCVAALVLASTYGLVALVALLKRSRPGLAIGVPAIVALAVRVVAAGGVSLTGIGQSLRGGDELGFAANAQALASSPLGEAGWAEALTSRLYEFTFALQMAIFGQPPELALRVTQSALSVAGLVLMATAVYELAGPRAARLTLWILAFEPANVFFSSLLHKEPLMFLGEGLVAFGGAQLWSRGRLRAIVPMAAGCLIAVATRPYVGWFLIAAAAAITLHSSLRHRSSAAPRALSLAAIVVFLVAVTAPTVWNATSPRELRKLQSSQDANASDASNLKLERVDYSTLGAVLENLPGRVGDVAFRPFAWQVSNASQQLGMLGTIIVLGALALLGQALIRSRGAVMERAGPLIYVAGLLLVAYSLSAGNAGTAFRYRTHVLACVLALIVVLRERQRADSTSRTQVVTLQDGRPFGRPLDAPTPAA